MKRTELTQITLLAALLESEAPEMPNGAIHVSLSRQFEDGGVTYTRDTVDRTVTRADLVARARALFADVAQEIADNDATPVKASTRQGAALTMPKAAPGEAVEAAPVTREG